MSTQLSAGTWRQSYPGPSTTSTTTITTPNVPVLQAEPTPEPMPEPLVIYPAQNGYVVCPPDLFSAHNAALVSHMLNQLAVFTDIQDAFNYITTSFAGWEKQRK